MEEGELVGCPVADAPARSGGASVSLVSTRTSKAAVVTQLVERRRGRVGRRWRWRRCLAVARGVGDGHDRLGEGLEVDVKGFDDASQTERSQPTKTPRSASSQPSSTDRSSKDGIPL
jgi:hypothetical protein